MLRALSCSCTFKPHTPQHAEANEAASPPYRDPKHQHARAGAIEDQHFKLKERGASEGWHTAGTYSDAATSGASMMRPGIQSLLQDAASSKFDIVLCEALDRLSRNQADIARIYEQLSFHGIKIITLSEGLVSELHVGLKGTMNALFLKDLADKIRRGLEGRVRAGKSGGGKAYDYTVPVKFTASGERISRLNPETELVTHEVPKLRIISDDLWASVKECQKILDAPKNSIMRPFHSKQRPKFFWSGKLKCGQCGGSYTKVSKDLLGCATSRNKGTAVCGNRKNIRVDILEDHLLTSLQHHLMEPEHFADFINAFTQELNRLQGEARGERSHIEARINKITNQLDKAVDAILDGADVSFLKDRMKQLEAKKTDLEAKLASITDEPKILLHPSMPALYKERVAGLTEALRDDKQDRTAFEAIRGLLNTVTLTPTERGFDFDILGELERASWDGASHTRSNQNKTAPRLPEAVELAGQGVLVAGVGFTVVRYALSVAYKPLFHKDFPSEPVCSFTDPDNKVKGPPT